MNSHDTNNISYRGPRVGIFTRLYRWWRAENARAELACREIAQQRDAERREFLAYRGLIK